MSTGSAPWRTLLQLNLFISFEDEKRKHLYFGIRRDKVESVNPSQHSK